MTMINVWESPLCTYIPPTGYSREFHANLPLMSSSLDLTIHFRSGGELGVMHFIGYVAFVQVDLV